MTEPIRILFVSFADSPHVQGWLRLLEGHGFDVRLFTTPLHEPPAPTADWHCLTYVTQQPTLGDRRVQSVRWLLPVLPKSRTFLRWFENRFRISARWLRYVIRTWRPQIVHSLPLDTGGKLARAALESMPAATRPRWVASSWGSDLSVGLLRPDRAQNVAAILELCDGFMADCEKDLDLAEAAGLAPGKRCPAGAVPGNGGIDLQAFAALRSRRSPRNVVLIPKAFEREHANRAFTVIEALRLAGDALDGFEVHLLMCSASVRAWLAEMPESLRSRCRCHDQVPQRDVFELLSRARAMVAPSLADGTPNVLLEAMAAGALPIMSPLPSTHEWIVDGRNGLMARALYPEEIAAAIRRAVTDDDLFVRASEANWEIVRRRADREVIARQVGDYYRSLAG